MRVAVLGAGDMGTAITAPIAANGHDVRLWGTTHDEHIIAALQAGQVHPRLQHPIDPAVDLLHANQIEQALAEADLLVVAVSSGAIDIVLDLVLATGMPVPPVLSLAKGLWHQPHEPVQVIGDRIQQMTGAPVIVVGGPAKANEVALHLPTVSVFASDDAGANQLASDLLQTPMYRAQTTTDRIGVELAAAMKNAYAIAVGVATGLEARLGLPHQNLKAALFPFAIEEMARLVHTLGGHPATVFGLAGVGDLSVTVAAGRNRLLGEMLGRGQPVADALAALVSTGMTIEGHAAAQHGYQMVRDIKGPGGIDEFPMLQALHRILFDGAPAFETLWDAISGQT